jgi:murein DD-endopeptidase MepM/ murein hydrolase activator NlpD
MFMLRRSLCMLFVLAGWISCAGTSCEVAAEPLRLILPTSNDALLRDDGAAFYMYTDRTFEGRQSRPWEAGQYGFVRNPKSTAAGIVYTRFHEGIDIQPLFRSRSGEPLDTVRAVDRGLVVYVNAVEARSSYGKYVVVEHWWSGSPFYSLYAHLGSVAVRSGEQIAQGTPLGIMGYTGRGLNQRRAHLHLEINMLLNENFQQWFDVQYRGANPHGIYNGINLAGIDVGALYLALRDDPELTIKEFFARKVPAFAVTVPDEGMLDLLRRYPWLSSDRHPWLAGRSEQRVEAWEVSFTGSGVPVRVEPSPRRVAAPAVASVAPSRVPHVYLTNGMVSGSGSTQALTSSGQRFLSLLTLAPSAAIADRSGILALEPASRVTPKPKSEVDPGSTGLSLDEVLRRLSSPPPESEETPSRSPRLRGW